MWANRAFRVVDVLRLVQRVHHQAAVHRHDGDRALPPGDHHPGQRHALGPADRVAQHDVDVLPGVPVRRHVVAGVVVHRVDGIHGHELVDGDGAGAFDPCLFEVLVVQQDVPVLLELVAARQVLAGQLIPGFRVQRDAADAVARVRIDEVEVQRRRIMPRGVQGHRAGHQGQAQMPPPDRPFRHQRTGLAIGEGSGSTAVRWGMAEQRRAAAPGCRGTGVTPPGDPRAAC